MTFIVYFQTNLSVPGNAKDAREIIPKDNASDLIHSRQEKDKENKEMSPSITTATPTITTITITDKKDKTKKKEINKYRHINSANIPKFYFPFGKPMSSDESEKTLKNALDEIAKLSEGKVYKHQMGAITKVIIVPS